MSRSALAGVADGVNNCCEFLCLGGLSSEGQLAMAPVRDTYLIRCHSLLETASGLGSEP